MHIARGAYAAFLWRRAYLDRSMGEQTFGSISIAEEQGARHAGKTDFGRQPHRPHLPAARSVVVSSAAEMEADGAARRGEGRRAPLVRRRPGQGHVERHRPGISALPEGDVRSYR